MSDGKNKPRGVLEGISKSFVGLPYSYILSTEEQGVRDGVGRNELVRSQTSAIRTQGDKAQAAATRALTEVQSIRRGVELGAIATEGSRRELMGVNENLERMGGTLDDGFSAVSQGLGKLDKSVQTVHGLPTEPQNADELIGSGQVQESEVIILAMSGGLNPEQERKLYRSLDPWKQEVIDTRLVYEHNPRMERTLDKRQKVFLAELRRKAQSSVTSFGSLEQLSWNGTLEDTFKLGLSKTVKKVRTGMIGMIHATHELSDKSDTMIAQNSEGLAQRATLVQQGSRNLDLQKTQVAQNDMRISQAHQLNELTRANVLIGKASLEELGGIRSGIHSLVDFEKLAQIDRSANRVANEETARNTHTIARGVAAQVYLAQRAEKRLDVIAEATAGTCRNTELLTVFAEEANKIAMANLSVNAATAKNTAETAHNTAVAVDRLTDLVEIEAAGLEISAATAGYSAMTAENTGMIAADVNELVGFAERAEYANSILIQQADERNRLLGDMADGIDTGNYYQALTREAIQEAHLTLIQGLTTSSRIGIEILKTSMRANDLLSSFIKMSAASHIELREALEQIEAGHERRHLSKNRASAIERYEEGLGRYRKGKIDDAIRLLNSSIDSWSNDHRVYFYRGLCYVLKDMPEKAEENFSEALIWAEEEDARIRAIIKMNLARLYYSESKVHFEKGDSSLSDEKMFAAIMTAKEACDEDPDFHQAAFALATYEAAYGLYDEARDILMRIIPKEPAFAVKVLYTDEFAPILDSFKNTLQEEASESTTDTMNRVSIAVIKDCIELGDFSTAIACMRDLIHTGSVHLLRMKVWKIDELNPMRGQLIKVVMEEAESLDSSNPQNCYALAMLMLNMRSDSSEISDIDVFAVFLKGTEEDPDVKAQNKIMMLKKLKALSNSRLEDLLAINKLHRQGLAWLK